MRPPGDEKPTQDMRRRQAEDNAATQAAKVHRVLRRKAQTQASLAQVRGRDLAREIRDPEDIEAGHGRPGPRSLLRFASVQEVCVWSCLQGEELVR